MQTFFISKLGRQRWKMLRWPALSGIFLLFASPGVSAQQIVKLFCQVNTQVSVVMDREDGFCSGFNRAASEEVLINLDLTKKLWWRDGGTASYPLGVLGSEYTLKNWTGPKGTNTEAANATINRISGRLNHSDSYLPKGLRCGIEATSSGQCEPAATPKF